MDPDVLEELIELAEEEDENILSQLEIIVEEVQ